ncbi:unnamed protein product, partial [Heterotrigona itama]
PISAGRLDFSMTDKNPQLSCGRKFLKLTTCYFNIKLAGDRLPMADRIAEENGKRRLEWVCRAICGGNTCDEHYRVQ